MTFSAIVLSGLGAVYEYVVAHTLFCLVPAFFIAGAMAALIPRDLLLPYLGKDSPRRVAYPLAVASGLLLAVCSCTVLPLFAGIRKGGAGIGPGIAFLYTAPATNIVAILYTGSLIGWDVAGARILLSVLFAISIGMLISRVFPEAVETDAAVFARSPGERHDLARLLYLFGALVGILLVGTRVTVPWVKHSAVVLLVAAALAVARSRFAREEVRSWMHETWGFVRAIAPLLLAGVFVSGMVRVLLPQGFVTTWVGSNSLTALLIPVVFGVLVYFPTLVEVPMARTFLDLGMGKGPLMAYLLADPVLSLPSILVVSRIMGARRTATYVGLIILFTLCGGYLFGLVSALP